MSSTNNIRIVDYIVVTVLLVASTVLFFGSTVNYFIASIVIVSVLTIVELMTNKSMKNELLQLKNYGYLRWFVAFFLFIAVHYYFVHWDSLVFLRRMRIWLPALLMMLWLMRIKDEDLLIFFGKCCVLATIPFGAVILINNDLLMAIALGERLGDTETGMNANMIALCLLFLFYFSFVLFNKEPRWRPFVIVVLIGLAAATFITGCRRAVLAMFLILIVYSLCFGSKARRIRNIFLMVVVVAVVVYLMIHVEYLYDILGYRFLKLFDSIGLIHSPGIVDSDDYSTEIRKEFVPLAIKMFFENPILGNGYGYFIMHNGLDTLQQSYNTHNNYLELLVSYGIVGFALYYSIIVSTVVKLIKYRKKDETLVFLLLFMFINLVLVDPTTVHFTVYSIFYVQYYICYRMVNSREYIRSPK